MDPSQLIQSLIHKLEYGIGRRILRILLLIVSVVALVFSYDSCVYRNFSTPEAMDAAQLARNISEGKGYTTLVIRPFSLYLMQSHNVAKYANAPTNAGMDFAQIKTAHPDLANPPVYPVLLAGLMKVMDFRFDVDTRKPFWSKGGAFLRYQPDFLIAVFNEVLLLVVTVMTYFLARKMFDPTVAWLTALLTIGCELLWRFSVSGLSTLLLMIIFLGLTRCLLKVEEMAREPQPRLPWLFGLAVAAGGLAGVGALTRYAFGWVIVPVAVFLLLFGGQRRIWQAVAALGAFMIVLLPWVIRNFAVSGTPFGTAGYAVVEGTFAFPGFQLERLVHPDLSIAFWLKLYTYKLLGNLYDIFQNKLPKLGGSWASMFFLVGLLMGFRGAASRRLRYFLLMCLGTFIVVQALGRTGLSDESPEVNSENLIVLTAPLVFIYGVVFFLTFLGQMKLPVSQLRYAIISLFVALSCLPMIDTLFASKVSPVAYPPYYPPDIQKAAGWMKENELMMSDVPWAVAWYGHHQCVWLTLNAQDDFFAINDNLKPVQGLYLTPETLDAKLLSDCVRGGENTWGNFLLKAMAQNQMSSKFPLMHTPSGSAAIVSGLFLTDRVRW